MASLEDAATLAMALPETVEQRRSDGRCWSVRGKVFAWERPFRKADLKRFGAEPPPTGAIMAIRVEDLGDKEAVLASGSAGFFTISHFDGYAAVLVQLDVVAEEALRQALEDGWLACAPAAVVRRYLDATPDAG